MNKKLLEFLSKNPAFASLYAKASGLVGASEPAKNKAPKAWFTVRNSEDPEEPGEISIFDSIGYDYWSDSGTGAADYAKALASIPAGKPVNVKINSPGGNLWDGLAIAAMNEARGNVTCIVLGVAASAASVVAVKCAKTIMAPSSTMMIHNAQSVCAGSQYDMAEAMECLAIHDEVLAGLYAAKAGCKPEEMAAAMKATTWYTADQAKAAGLCDEINGAVAPANSFDFSTFRNIPKNLLTGGAVLTAEGKPQAEEPTIMNRQKILALLKTWGVSHPENATDDQLAELVIAGKPTAAAPPAPNAAQPAAGAVTPEQLTALTRELETMRAERNRERDARVTASVDAAVAELRIPTNQRDAWLARAKADEAVLNLIPATPPHRQEPVAIELVSADVRNVLTEFERFNAPTASLLKGNAISMDTLKNSAFAKANHFAKHKASIMEVMNATTVATELKRQVILQTIVRDFARRLLPLRAFASVFANVPLQGTDKIEVPFYDLDTTSNTSWVAATGYTSSSTTVDKREITVDKRNHLGALYTSQDLARQPFLNVQMTMQLKAEKLASDVVADVLSVITAANYSTAAVNKPADSFSSDDLPDIKYACRTWPDVGRTLFVDSAVDQALLKDVSFKHALNAASDSAIKEGRLYPRVFGFDYVENPNIPTNSENLIGFACFQSAILFASSPIAPSEDVIRAGTMYEVAIDPQTGIALEYRAFGNNVLDRSERYIEVNYGYAKGLAGALKRLTSA